MIKVNTEYKYINNIMLIDFRDSQNNISKYSAILKFNKNVILKIPELFFCSEGNSIKYMEDTSLLSPKIEEGFIKNILYRNQLCPNINLDSKYLKIIYNAVFEDDLLDKSDYKIYE